MSEYTEDQVLKWITCIGTQVTTDVLEELELKTEGSNIQKLNRLSRWLLGNYSASDFLESCRNDSESDKTARIKVREEFISRMVLEKSGSTLYNPDGTEVSWEEHPLSFLVKDDAVKGNLSTTLAAQPAAAITPSVTSAPPSMGTGQTVDPGQNGQLQGAQDQNAIPPGQPIGNDTEVRPIVDHGEPQDKGDDGLHVEEVVVQETPPTSTTKASTWENVPTELMDIIHGLHSKMDGMKKAFDSSVAESRQVRVELEQVKQHIGYQSSNRNRASSTRLDTQQPYGHHQDLSMDGPRFQGGARVGFSETYTCNQYNASSPLATRQTARINQLKEVISQAQLELSALESEPPQNNNSRTNYGAPNSGNRHNQVGLPHHSGKDIGHIVRRWELKFNGRRDQSIEYFLTRCEECRESSGLTKDEVLHSLSELLTGVAYTWYSNHRSQWKTWEEFCLAARSWYGTGYDYNYKLKQEAFARTQGADEPVRDYLTKIQAYLVQMVPRLPIREQLELMVANLYPPLRKMIHLDDIRDIFALKERAMEAELLLEQERNYRPPIPPESSMLKDLAYFPSKASKATKPGVSACDTREGEKASKVSGLTMEQMFHQMKEILKTFEGARSNPQKSNKTKSNKDGQKSGGKSRSTSKDRPRGKSPDDKTKKPLKKDMECFLCQEKGHFKHECPKKSGNGKDTE